MTSVVQSIKNIFQLTLKIKKLFKNYWKQKYYIVKKDNFFIPKSIIRREGFVPVNVFYYVYPFNKTYSLVKLQVEYIKEEDYNKYNRTLLINTVYENGIPEDYFWIYNIYQYMINKKIDLVKDVYINVDKETEDKDPRKLMRYNFIQDIIFTYNENLLKIYKDSEEYIDLSKEFFYFKNKEQIDSFINIIKKLNFQWKDNKLFNIVLDFDWIQNTKQYKKLEKVVDYFNKKPEIYPLLFEYLDSNNNESHFLFPWNNKEYLHKIFRVNDLESIKINKIPTNFIYIKGSLVLNLAFYLYVLEKIFFKTFLRRRDISKLKLSLNEKINLDKIERLPLLMGQLLSDNLVLLEMIKFYNIIHNKSLIGGQEYYISYNLWESNSLFEITDKMDNDIKSILKDGEYAKMKKEDYILEELDTEFFKYKLEHILPKNYITNIVKEI